MNAECKNEWYVYVVKTSCNKLYTGISTDVVRRFEEHSKCYSGVSKKGAKFFRGKKPEAIVYVERCVNRSLASKREYQIKKMSTQKKRALTDQYQAAKIRPLSQVIKQ